MCLLPENGADPVWRSTSNWIHGAGTTVGGALLDGNFHEAFGTATGVTGDIVRLSVGIEHPVVIAVDLEVAIESASGD